MLDSRPLLMGDPNLLLRRTLLHTFRLAEEARRMAKASQINITLSHTKKRRPDRRIADLPTAYTGFRGVKTRLAAR